MATQKDVIFEERVAISSLAASGQETHVPGDRAKQFLPLNEWYVENRNTNQATYLGVRPNGDSEREIQVPPDNWKQDDNSAFDHIVIVNKDSTNATGTTDVLVMRKTVIREVA